MIAILSPAKSFDESLSEIRIKTSLPEFIKESEQLVEGLQSLSVDDLQDLYRSNKKIAEANFLRFQQWHTIMPEKAAILSYVGEVYRGLQAEHFATKELNFSNKVIRILSGLYGVLRPLDVIQPYRFEMESKFDINGKKSLYRFWTDKITANINNAIDKSKGDKVLVNLASLEYSKAINPKKLAYPILNVDFKQDENGDLKNKTVYAKKARGLMAKFIVENEINEVESLQAFDYDGYAFSSYHSQFNKWTFIR